MLRFDAFLLDRTRRGLYRGGERVHLTAKPLETLIYLVERRGRTVEKQELLDAIWKDTAVTEDTLVHAVREIRRALGDDKADPRFVQTVPRHGYRFVAAVSEEGTFEGPPPRLSPTRDRRTRWQIAAGVCLVTLAALTIWFTSRDVASVQPHDAIVLEQLTPAGLNAGKPTFAMDGNILYNSGGALFVRVAGSDTALQITDRIQPSGDMPVFTADGRHVVFAMPRNGEDGSRTYDLHQVASVGGRQQLFIAEASGAGFSPDGKWVAYTKHLPDRKALWISPVDRLDTHVEVRSRGFVPRWSPDGRRIAYTSGDPNATEGELWTAAVSSSPDGRLTVADHTPLTSEAQPMYGLSWTQDGQSVIFAARRRGGPTHLYRVAASGGRVAALTSGAGDYACPSVSPDGKRLIFWHGTPVRNLMLADGPESANVRLVTDDEYHLSPALSPSATHVASVIRRPTYEEHLYVTDITTKKRTEMSARPASHPSWVDETTVAYLERSGSGQTDIQLVNTAGAQSPIRLAVFSAHAIGLAVHPAKTAVAVVLASHDGRQRIVLRRLGAPELERTLVEGGEYERLRWLPDGSALSWSGPERSSSPASNGIWVMKPEAAAPQRIVADGYGPVWSGDGATVYFSRIREYAGLWQRNLRDGRESELRRWPEGQYEFDIVGNRLIFTQQGGIGRILAMSLER